MQDSRTPVLVGYRYSVYTRSVAMALRAKGVRHDMVECDPFDPARSGDLHRLHPFGRVPVLTPGSPRAAARMRQVMGIADAHVYGPLVRGVVENAVFAPLEGTAPDCAALTAGLKAAPRILDVLDGIVAEGLTLTPGRICLAACLLWPMLDYFARVPDGARLLQSRPALDGWARFMAAHPVAVATRPDLT